MYFLTKAQRWQKGSWAGALVALGWTPLHLLLGWRQGIFVHIFNFSKQFKEFVETCLNKDPENRPSAKELMRHPFIKKAKKNSYLMDLIDRWCPPKYINLNWKGEPMSKRDEPQYISKGWIELVILNIKVGRFFCFSKSFFATNKIAQASQVEADEGGGKWYRLWRRIRRRGM